MKISKEFVQAEINVGVVGHVDHGKTSLVKALTEEWADRHSEEIKRGITIKLGYADAEVYYCEKCKTYGTKKTCPNGHEAKFQRKISFVDCPGHESLMAIMLSGSSLMDGALLIVAANEPCPQPQTAEHLSALNIAGIKKIIIIQNKIDLVTKEQAKKHYEQIKAFVKGSVAEDAPIIPVAAHYNVNIDEAVKAIQDYIPTPKRDLTKPFKMLIARSFDINKPGTEIMKLNGGVIGGSILQGEIKENDDVEITPGIKVKDKYVPIKTKVMSISIKEGLVKIGRPGGLIGLGTKLDPSLTKGDNLVGNFVVKPGSIEPAKEQITIESKLFEKSAEAGKIEPLKINEMLLINAGTSTTVGTIIQNKKNLTLMNLKKPICVEKEEKVGLARRSATRWYLIGYGTIK